MDEQTEDNKFEEKQDQSVEQMPNKKVESLSKSLMIKKFSLYVLIGGLVVSALISIVAVLIGDFNDLVIKSLVTTFLIVVHSMIAMAFVTSGSKDDNKSSYIVTNTLFGVTVASFITSIFSLWEIFTGDIVFDLYVVYLFAIIAALLCRSLIALYKPDKYVKILVKSSVGITLFMFILSLPCAFSNILPDLSDVYYRAIGATAILLGTSCILTSIFNNLYIGKHPEEKIHKEVTAGRIVFWTIFGIMSLLIFRILLYIAF